MDEDLPRFCCQYERCADHGQREIGNLTVCARYGKHKQHRLLYCRTWRYQFSERRGTPLFGPQLAQDKAVSLFRHIADRNGVRARLARSGWTPTRWSGTAAWPARTPGSRTTSSGLLPPDTREVQFDEQWSFVFKKQEHCDLLDPADDHRGDWWDHVAYDPEHRLILCVVPGARDAESVEEAVGEVKQRTGGRVMDLMTSDDYPTYETAILNAYGQEVTTTPSGRPSLRMVPGKVPPPGLNYATVEKRREKGHVVEVLTRVVFGTMAAIVAALGAIIFTNSRDCPMEVMTTPTTFDKVIAELEAVFHGKGLTPPPLLPQTVLDASLGLESIDFAELVVRLEGVFGKDPFARGDPGGIRTITDLSRLYET